MNKTKTQIILNILIIPITYFGCTANNSELAFLLLGVFLLVISNTKY